MKINDIVYVAYKGGLPVVLQVKLMTEFKKSISRSYKGLVCQAKFIKRYNLEEGWQPYQTHKASPDAIYRVEHRNLYASWEEVLEILQKLYLGRIEKQHQDIDLRKTRIQIAQDSLKKSRDRLVNLQNIDLRNHFRLEQDSYICPLTNQKK